MLGPWLRLLFLCRYPILAGLAMPALAAMALWVHPALLLSVLVLDTPWQLFNITWLAFLVGTSVLVTFRIIQLNAPVRFSSILPQTPASQPWRLRWLFLLGMILPLVVACAAAIRNDPSPVWTELAEWTRQPVWLLCAEAFLLGCGLSIILLIMFTALQQLLIHPDMISPNLLPFESWARLQWLRNIRPEWFVWLSRGIARVLRHFGPGYSVSITDRKKGKTYQVLAPGHAQALLWLGVAFLAYVVSYLLVHNAGLLPQEYSPFPALFFVLLLLLLLESFLAGAAFLGDYYLVPTLPALVILALLFSKVSHSDHFYELDPGTHPNDAADVEVTSLFKSRVFPPVVPQGGDPSRPTRTMVVVTAAGGGIQAAAWTAEVLAGLDEIYGKDFTRSVALISGVSGGSVGTMYYLANGSWSRDDPFDDDARVRIKEMARATALESTAWGVVYPEPLRYFFPLIMDPRVDRGWAIEEAWRRQLLKASGEVPSGDLRLRDWVAPIKAGKMPVPIFNATLVESGQRLIISPVRGYGDPQGAAAPREFFELYSNSEANPRLTTVVRLSATFPYVSPISRPYRSGLAANQEADYHVADGGYADNEGIVTCVDWIWRLIQYYHADGSRQKPFDRILLIRIQPFPLSKAEPPQTEQGWLYAATGPITTMENVRVASQSERGSLGLRLLDRATEGAAIAASPPDKRDQWLNRDRAWVKVSELRTQASIEKKRLTAQQIGQPQAKLAQEQKIEQLEEEGRKYHAAVSQASQQIARDVEVVWTAFVFQPDEGHLTPLSWKLTKSQKDQIDKAWQKIHTEKGLAPNNDLHEPPLKTLDRYFRRGKKG
jgi:hypothetical protein